MSYAGVESESEYAQRQYSLVPRENAERRERAAISAVLDRLDRIAEDLKTNDRISWKTAFDRLQDAIKAAN